ncbi:hypothetical protein NF212_09290 [Parasalinivibrio latis]|uniref:hypothetical protein n=1 Tax=Parasalinivibrio latis TaxID=2952610 RepID=UPI0030E3933B
MSNSTMRHSRLVTLIMLGLLPLMVWLVHLENPLVYFGYQTPPGQIQYVLSKLVGLYAIFFIWLQLLLALSTNSLRRFIYPKFSNKLHIRLGLTALTASVLHATLFVWGVSERAGHFAYHLLLPNFNSGYYNIAVSLGLFGLILIIAVGFSGKIRKVKASYIAKLVHRLSVPTFMLVFTHGFMIGTESRFSVMYYFYLSMAILLFFSVLFRLNEHKKTIHKVTDS